MTENVKPSLRERVEELLDELRASAERHYDRAERFNDEALRNYGDGQMSAVYEIRDLLSNPQPQEDTPDG